MRRVCIVGSGPSGFYTAKYLLRKLKDIQIDMLERLPMPFGLVRYGVAPDHPEVKNVINEFENIASNGNFRFFGNCSLGRDVTIESLRNRYDATVLAYGASGEKQLTIPGESLRGVYSAKEFVLWYNSHPDHFELKQKMYIDEGEPKVAAIIGNGNVSLDVARILTKDLQLLKCTDINEDATEYISQKQIEAVHIIGRRGWPQASFTNKELRELLTEDSILPIVDPADYKNCLTEANTKEIESSRPLQRCQKILEQMVQLWDQRHQTTKKLFQLHFLTSPVAFKCSIHDPAKLGSIQLTANQLIGPPHKQQCIPQDPQKLQSIDISLAVKSIGFKTMYMEGLPVNDGRLVHLRGRVFEPTLDAPFNGGLYASGWLKYGPSGVIAATIMDAQETASVVIEDLYKMNERQLPMKEENYYLKQTNKLGSSYTTFADYLKIRAEELSEGRRRGKTAVKFIS